VSRYNERLKVETEGSTRLTYTGLLEELNKPVGIFGYYEVFVYYEEKKRELHTIRIYECRCDERMLVYSQSN
jgi:hypothetical protein